MKKVPRLLLLLLLLPEKYKKRGGAGQAVLRIYERGGYICCLCLAWPTLQICVIPFLAVMGVDSQQFFQLLLGYILLGIQTCEREPTPKEVVTRVTPLTLEDTLTITAEHGRYPHTAVRTLALQHA